MCTDGSPVLSILIAAVAVTFLAIAYAGLVAVMPRAGGDYVWQTRVLDGLPGIVVGAVVGRDRVLPRLECRLGLGERSRSSLGVVGARRGGPSAGCAAASASSSRPPAGGSSSPCGRRSTARSSSSSSSSRSPRSSARTEGVTFFGSDNGDARRLDHRHRPDGRPRRPRDGGLCADPADLPVIWACSGSRSWRPHCWSSRRPTSRLRSIARTQSLFGVAGRVPEDDRRRRSNDAFYRLGRSARLWAPTWWRRSARQS